MSFGNHYLPLLKTTALEPSLKDTVKDTHAHKHTPQRVIAIHPKEEVKENIKSKET